MKTLLLNTLHYVREIFDESTPASFSRWATAATVLTGCWAVVHIVRHGHQLPDPLQLGALAAWMVAPYSVHKVAGVFNRGNDDRVAIAAMGAAERDPT
jgi:hypothetical protein